MIRHIEINAILIFALMQNVLVQLWQVKGNALPFIFTSAFGAECRYLQPISVKADGVKMEMQTVLPYATAFCIVVTIAVLECVKVKVVYIK